MSAVVDFKQNWEHFDSRKRGNPAWPKIPNPHHRTNPLNLELRHHWTFDWSNRAYVFDNAGDFKFGIVRSSDGFFRFWTTHVDFEGSITGHGNGPSDPAEWLDFLDRMLDATRKTWKREVKRSRRCGGRDE